MLWFKNFYIYTQYFWYIFFIISFFQISKNAPEYLNEINIILKVLICGFLLYRFNPLNKIILTPFDKMVVFDSALYLLFSSLFIDFYLLIKNKYSNLKKNTKKFIKIYKNNSKI